MDNMTDYPLELDGTDVPMVRFMNVTKQYGALTVLDDLNLDIAEGETVSIIGPSGSGKTTVLRMLMLEQINKGVIYVNGKPLTHMAKNGALVTADRRYLRTAREPNGMCFQHFNLFPHLTILENCTLAPIWVRKIPKREAEETAMHFLTKVKIPEQADKYPGQLSGGQQQRVAIARAIVNRPKLLLADEPTGALDSQTSRSILEIFKNLNRDGMTLVMVTHDEAVAQQCDRVITFRDGQLLSDRPTAPVLHSVSQG